VCLLLSDKVRTNLIEDLHMSVGVMKDYKVKLRYLHDSCTLGDVGDWNT
jgi:hypothetical protein